MYYLLEDNSIHYDGDKKKIQSATYDFNERKMCINGGKWKKWIKHSENVFDLIKTGDLVKFKNKSILKVYDQPHSIAFSVIAYDIELDVYVDEIIAIYKPNKNGDYIKQWEREDENEKN